MNILFYKNKLNVNSNTDGKGCENKVYVVSEELETGTRTVLKSQRQLVGQITVQLTSN